MSKSSTDNKTKSTEEHKSGHAKCLSNFDYVKKMRGELYEKISSAKIFKDFYLEDIAYPSKKITPNIELNFDKLKSEIAPLLIFGERPEKPELTEKIIEIKSKIEKCLTSFLSKNIKIQKEFSDSDISTDGEQNEKEKNKTLKYVKMDYVVKKINGKKINDCFKKLGDRNQELLKSFDIEDNKNFNICFQMTVRNDDIKKKKIFQLYKYAIWINLLQDITNLIMNADDDVKLEFNPLLNKIKTNYGILDSKCNTILIIVFNGNKEKFLSIKESINDNGIKTKYLKQLMAECKNKLNLYINYYTFQYDDNNLEMNNLYEKEKEERQKDRNEYEKKIIQYQKEIEKYLNEINKKKQENLKEKEKNENKIQKLENQIQKLENQISEEREKFEYKMSEAKIEFIKEREKLDKCNESLITYLCEKNELNLRIFKLESLLKENHIPFE